MSYTENHYIRLKEVEVDNLEEWLKKKCQDIKPEIKNPSDVKEDTWRDVYEFCLDEKYRDHLILNNKLYKITKHINLNVEDDFVNRNESGEIEICTSFYNGGCCFYEALEYNLNKLKRNETSRAEL